MAKKIVKMVYTFSELLNLEKQGKVSSEAVEKARQRLFKIELETRDNWYDCVFEDWMQALEQIGFMKPEIQFSGFACQGDGASFTAKVDLEKLIEFFSTAIAPSKLPNTEDWRPWLVYKIDGVRINRSYRKLRRVRDYIVCEVTRNNSHYVHERTCQFTLTFQDHFVDLSYDDTGELIFQSRTPRLRKLVESFKGSVEEFRLNACKAIYKDLDEAYQEISSEKFLTELSSDNGYLFDSFGHQET